MKIDFYKGYRGDSREVLIKFNVKVWSDVEIRSSKGIFKGVILPRSEIADDKHIVLKMNNGYNIGILSKSIARKDLYI